jgi:hypothetical protein
MYITANNGYHVWGSGNPSELPVVVMWEAANDPAEGDRPNSFVDVDLLTPWLM